MMSPDVALFLRDLLASQQVSVGSRDFLATTSLIAKAMAELNEIVEESA